MLGRRPRNGWAGSPRAGWASLVLSALAVAGLGGGCNAVFGIDDLAYVDPTTTAPTGQGGVGTGTASGTGGGTSQGGAGAAEPYCGNERTDPGEECDDGNEVAGDRCDPTCHEEHPDDCPGTPLEVGAEEVVITDTLQGATDTFDGIDEVGNCAGGVSWPGPDLIYAVTTTVSGELVAQLEPGYTHHWLHLRSACEADAGLDCDWGESMSAFDVVHTSASAGETYYVVVDAYGANAGAFTLRLRVAECGDGVVDPHEECDDGNATDDDNGCSADCLVDCGTNSYEDPETHHCYWTSAGTASWAAARNNCAIWGNGWTLVALSSAAERDFLDTVVPGVVLWTGGNDQASEGIFVWDNGEPWWDGGWGAGEPNGAETENCVSYDADEVPGALEDRSCGNARRFVCELRPGGTP